MCDVVPQPEVPYPRAMRTTVAALLLVAGGLVTACDGGSACDDVDELEQQLADSSPNDTDYYEISEKLNRARAECNAE